MRQGAGQDFCGDARQGRLRRQTIACNLAFQWKRRGAKKVLLADLDPLTGTMSFLLKIKSVFSFLDMLIVDMNWITTCGTRWSPTSRGSTCCWRRKCWSKARTICGIPR